jgi:hypothetical protein
MGDYMAARAADSTMERGRRFDSRERSWQEKNIVASLRRSAIGVAIFRRSIHRNR